MLFRNKEKQVLKLLKKNENEESQLMYYILNDLFQLQNDINNTKSLIDIKKAHIKYLIVTKNKLIKDWVALLPKFKKSKVDIYTKNLVLSFQDVINFLDKKFVKLESYYNEVYK